MCVFQNITLVPNSKRPCTRQGDHKSNCHKSADATSTLVLSSYPPSSSLLLLTFSTKYFQGFYLFFPSRPVDLTHREAYLRSEPTLSALFSSIKNRAVSEKHKLLSSISPTTPRSLICPFTTSTNVRTTTGCPHSPPPSKNAHTRKPTSPPHTFSFFTLSCLRPELSSFFRKDKNHASTSTSDVPAASWPWTPRFDHDRFSGLPTVRSPALPPASPCAARAAPERRSEAH